MTLVNAHRLGEGKHAVGWLNPTLYASGGQFVLNDIVAGNNSCAEDGGVDAVCCSEGFAAAPGWDPATGWGSVDFQKLKAVIEMTPPPTPPVVVELKVEGSPDPNNDDGIDIPARFEIAAQVAQAAGGIPLEFVRVTVKADGPGLLLVTATVALPPGVLRDSIVSNLEKNLGSAKQAADLLDRSVKSVQIDGGDIRSSSGGGGGLSAGVIAGIVIGAVCCVLVVAAIAIYYGRRNTAGNIPDNNAKLQIGTTIGQGQLNTAARDELKDNNNNNI